MLFKEGSEAYAEFGEGNGEPGILGGDARIMSQEGMALLDDAITACDGLRDPRQRDRPTFAGCGRLDGVPGTFPTDGTANETAALLDVSEPLVLEAGGRTWDAHHYVKEW